MWPQDPEEWSIKRNRARLPVNRDTFQLFSYIVSMQFSDSFSAFVLKITFPSTISSARVLKFWQPAPIRNVRKFVSIKKPGDVIEPWGSSPCFSPAGWEELGRFSKVPIHQSPRWFDGSVLPVPSFLNLSDGLSPYVGWLLNAVPFNVQFDKSWSSKSKMV